MNRQRFFLIICLMMSTVAFAQPLSLYRKYAFIQGGDTLPYRILLPPDYDSKKSYPLVLFLHGRGESGNDNEKQLNNGASLFLADSNRQRFPSIVVFPQCAANSYWSNVRTIADSTGARSFYFITGGDPSSSMRLLISLTEHLLAEYPVNKSQVYVMGLSMGGMGTFELVRRMPNQFAAAVAICGGANTGTAAKIRNTKWWIFHGAKDRVVLPTFSRQMHEALLKVGAKSKLTIYPDADHNSWDAAFAEPRLLPWLYSHKK